MGLNTSHDVLGASQSLREGRVCLKGHVNEASERVWSLFFSISRSEVDDMAQRKVAESMMEHAVGGRGE